MKLALIELANKWQRHANSLRPSGGGGSGRVEYAEARLLIVGGGGGGGGGGNGKRESCAEAGKHNQGEQPGVEKAGLMDAELATNLAVAEALAKCSSELRKMIELLSEDR